MKKIILLFIVFPILALTACSKSLPTNELYYTKEKDKENVKLSTIKLDENYSVYDLICIDDKIIATDSENDCLLIINKESGETQTKGQTGNGNDDYLNPHGIWCKGDSIYVVDSGNNRIKIIDLNLNFQKAIDLSEIEFWNAAPTFWDDISVDNNENIFLTVNSCVKKDAKLYCIENGSDKPKVIMNNCTGVITSNGNKTYFANTYEFIENLQTKSGTNYIYEIENYQIINKYTLPSGYAPSGISTNGDDIYCSSYCFQEVSNANLNSLTVTSFFSEPVIINAQNKRDIKYYGSLIYDDNYIWLIETNNNEIYKLTEE